tara:strand:- start:7097 stop:7753 length:657 start_codon:yes stop_codon:yes gene_type:complete
MPTPIVIDELFKLNPDRKITYHKNYVCIDNYYKNIGDIQNVLENMHVESWKMSQWSRNFKDYYDCRPAFANWEPRKELLDARLTPLNNLLSEMMQRNDFLIEKSLSFNVFKHIKKDVPNYMQHHPHYDTNMVNVLVYLDAIEDGGTNLYQNEDVENKEASTLLVDIRKYKLIETIPAKLNRCVIFNGNQLHGAFIQDNNKYYADWRVTQASIIKYGQE